METGMKAIDFTLPDSNGKDVTLSDYKGEWVVLYFYPKDNTKGCTDEALDFTAHLKDFNERKAVVIGVSPDSVKSHLKFIDTRSLTVTLLSDEEKKVLESYGVWQKKKMYGKEYMGVVRATFLIDTEGVIQRIWPKVRVKGHAEEVLAALDELR